MLQAKLSISQYLGILLRIIIFFNRAYTSLLHSVRNDVQSAYAGSERGISRVAEPRVEVFNLIKTRTQ